MRRVAIVLLAALGFVLGAAGTVIVWEQLAGAQDVRVIPVIARSAEFPIENTAALGEPCRLIDFDAPGIRTPHQIVIADSTGAIVAVHTLDGALARDDQGARRCIADADIPVPELPVYTVHLGDQRLRAYTADEFPISTDDAIQLVID